MIDHYQILEIPHTANQEEIKKAFRKLSFQYHPDKNGNNPEAYEKFLAVKEAYEVLSDESKKLLYDANYHTIQYGADKKLDPLFMDAGKIVMINQSCSLSLLKLELGINSERAKKIIQELEIEGIVAPLKGPLRQILLTKEEFEYKYNVIIPQNFRSSNVKDEDYIVRPDGYSPKKSTGNLFKRIRQIAILTASALLVYEYREPIGVALSDFYTEYIEQYVPNSDTNENTGIVQAKSGLKMRSEPSVEAKLIIVIPNGTKVSILQTDGPNETINGRSANWYKVNYESNSGWVWGGFIATQQD